jgi:hypothetical protein
MKVKLVTLFCAAALVFLAGAAPATAGQFSVGVSVGYPGYPAYGYFGYSSAPPAYVYPAYGPPVVYAAPVVQPYYYPYYAPYGYRAVPVYRPYYVRPYRGGRYGAYAPRRYHHHH